MSCPVLPNMASTVWFSCVITITWVIAVRSAATSPTVSFTAAPASNRHARRSSAWTSTNGVVWRPGLRKDRRPLGERQDALLDDLLVDGAEVLIAGEARLPGPLVPDRQSELRAAIGERSPLIVEHRKARVAVLYPVLIARA